MLEELKNREKAIGMKQSLKAVENGTAELVYMAKDADEKVVSALKELCRKKALEITYVDNMKLLGKACGIDVGAASVCVLKAENGR